MAQDMRTYLADLEAAGELVRVTREVDPDLNMGGLAFQAASRLNKAVLFENISGHPGWKAASYICGSRSKLAVSLGTTSGKFLQELRSRLQKGLTPIRMVDDGPVKEIIMKGSDVDMTRIPFHKMADADAGRYSGSGMHLVKDPETGVRNISLHRNQLQGPNQLGILIAPTRHLHMVYQKYEAMNKPMPVAVVYGHHAAYYLAANYTASYDVDELEVAGSILGEPVEMVKCETIDLEVPAHAEIVVEAEIPPHKRIVEGPFTEHTGYSRAGAGLNPYLEVKCITMRRNAVYYALQGGRPIAESQVLDGAPMEMVLFERLKDVGGFVNLKDVVVPPYVGGAHLVIIQLAPRVEGEVNDVLMAALSSQYIHPRIVIAVDEDVDPHDPQQVFWSLSTRCNPATHTFVVPETKGLTLDASARLVSPPGVFPQIRLGSKMGINACKPPVRLAEEREEHRISVPQGMGEYRIEDFVT
ncbi:MAG: UbiD family decarboxylase [Firmicutes bacterium]|nr:UbiD family decarboxylase [Bacillota bacterium]